jgi:diguanylate cyclase (GGDEF)-like protein
MGARSQPPSGFRMALAMAFLCVAGTSWAACMPSPDPRMAEFDRLMLARPAAAARAIESRLATNEAKDPAFRAELLVALADANASLEEHAGTRQAVAAGFVLVRDMRSTPYLNLVYLDTMTPKTESEIEASRKRAEALMKLHAEGSRAQACVLIALGLLEHYADRPDQASIHLTRAHRMSAAPEQEQTRILAATVLSMVLRALNDEQGALKLNQEVIDSYLRRGAEFDLATAYFLRGFILTELHKHQEALDVLGRSQALSVKLGDATGAAYADILICTNELGLGALEQARARCEKTLALFEAANSEDPAKQALLVLAEIDLAEHQPAAALQKLNRVLSQGGVDMAPFRVTHAFDLRSRAHRELKNYQAALADTDSYLVRFKANKEDQRAREAAAGRARFETDREKERNEFLQRELQVRNERIDAQAARLRWMIVAAVTGACVILLLGMLLASNRRKKRLLGRLATEDELTGLANRRHMLKKAGLAFESIREKHAPLTLAILDLDFFKRINDAFGHAAGDHVLREFARIARENVRKSDLLGRWGGEEFLLVMPDTALDVALAAVERIRQAAAKVQGGPLPAGFQVTISAGMAHDDGRYKSLDDLIAEADEALYMAKDRGRDRVQIAQQSFDASATNVRRSLRGAGVDMKTGKHEIAR